MHDGEAKNETVLDALFQVAEEVGAKPGQIAIAWVAAKGVIPVIGPRTLAQLEENLASVEVKLSPDQIERLDEVSAVPLGYPQELVSSPDQRAAITGGRLDQIDFPIRTVA